MIRNLFFTIYPKIKDVFILLWNFTLLVFLAIIVLWITYPLILKYFNFVFFFSCNYLIYLFIFDRKFSNIKAFEITQKVLFVSILAYLAVFIVVVVFVFDLNLNNILYFYAGNNTITGLRIDSYLYRALPYQSYTGEGISQGFTNSLDITNSLIQSSPHANINNMFINSPLEVGEAPNPDLPPIETFLNSMLTITVLLFINLFFLAYLNFIKLFSGLINKFLLSYTFIANSWFAKFLKPGDSLSDKFTFFAFLFLISFFIFLLLLQLYVISHLYFNLDGHILLYIKMKFS